MIDVRKTLENLHQILPNLSIEDLFRVLGWRPYDTGTFISYASNGITLSDEGTCK